MYAQKAAANRCEHRSQEIICHHSPCSRDGEGTAAEGCGGSAAVTTRGLHAWPSPRLGMGRLSPGRTSQWQGAGGVGGGCQADAWGQVSAGGRGGGRWCHGRFTASAACFSKCLKWRQYECPQPAGCKMYQLAAAVIIVNCRSAVHILPGLLRYQILPGTVYQVLSKLIATRYLPNLEGTSLRIATSRVRVIYISLYVHTIRYGQVRTCHPTRVESTVSPTGIVRNFLYQGQPLTYLAY